MTLGTAQEHKHEGHIPVLFTECYFKLQNKQGLEGNYRILLSNCAMPSLIVTKNGCGSRIASSGLASEGD